MLLLSGPGQVAGWRFLSLGVTAIQEAATVCVCESCWVKIQRERPCYVEARKPLCRQDDRSR